MGAGGKAWLEHFTTDEIRELRAIRDHRAWLTLGVNYGLIAASMALVAYAPNVLTVVLALCIIGARQLGFAVVMHESAHHTLFNVPRASFGASRQDVDGGRSRLGAGDGVPGLESKYDAQGDA
jgi:fatty acid desaturase